MYKSFSLVLLTMSVNIVLGQPPTLVLPIGHLSQITSVQFSPDTKRVYTNSGSECKMWDLATGKLIYSLYNINYSFNHQKETTTLCANGKYILAASVDSSASIFDAITGKLIHSLIGHNGDVEMANFSPDGMRALTGSSDSTAKIWDVETGKLLFTLIQPKKWYLAPIKIANYSPDGKHIVTATENEMTIWESDTGRFVFFLRPGVSEWAKRIKSFKFSPDGKLIITFFDDNSSRIWDINSGKLLYACSAIREDAKFSPDSKFILSVSPDSTARICDAETGRAIDSIKLLLHKVYQVDYSPDGKKIITVSYDSSAKVWDVISGKQLFSLNSNSEWFSFFRFSSDGRKIITISPDNNCIIWDGLTGKLLKSFRGHTKATVAIKFSADGKFIYTDFKTKIWETATSKLVRTLDDASVNNISNDHKYFFSEISYGKISIGDFEGTILHSIKVDTNFNYSCSFSSDSKFIMIISVKKDVNIWYVSTGKLFKSLEKNNSKVEFAQFSPDGKYISIKYSDGLLKIFNWKNGRLVCSIKVDKDMIGKVCFDPNGKYIATVLLSGTKPCKIWDIKTGKLFRKIDGYHFHDLEEDRIDAFNSIRFSPLGNFIITTSTNDFNKVVKVWNVATGQLIIDKEELVDNIKGINFSHDEKYLAIGFQDGTVNILNVTTKAILYSIDEYAAAVCFSPEGTKIITASGDHTCKVWSSKDGKLLYKFFGVDSLDYFVQISAGYYMCSQNASKLLHYVTKDSKVITFEQLDVKYNRPDKVLEAIGNMDTALIKSYRKAYEKRIKKLGIDTTAFREGYSVPEADIANRDAIEYEQKNESIILQIKSGDSTYKLDRFNIWVNEVAIFGLKGKSIRRRNGNSFDTTITIKLSQGENSIETSITNVNGTESYRMPLIVNYTPAVKQKESTHFIGIGIDQFADKKYNLEYSTKDIRDLALKLKEKYGNDIVIDTLFNENVTVENVKALKKKLQQTTENDKVIIAYSGHGLLSKEYDYYLSTYAVNFEKPEINGLPYDELESLLDSIPARKKLMLIDACHSGEVDKDEGIAMNKMADSLGLTKGVIIPSNKQKQVGLKNSFELMQSLFVNVGKSTGATIISAAAGNQFALERGDLKNGVFTFSILEAMEKYPTLKISELKKIVGERVEQLTNGMQKPTSRNETIAVDWEVW